MGGACSFPVLDDEVNRFPQRLWIRVAAIVLFLAAGTTVAVSLDLPSVGDVRSWVQEGGPARWLTLVLGLAVALLTPVSRTALSVLVGAVAGFPAGLAIALSGGLLGGLAGFALSRSLGREAMARVAGNRLARIDRQVSKHGFVSVLAARIMPVAPFVVVSYAAGLSGIRLRPYLLGTAVGLVPWSVLYVGIGAAVGSVGSWASLVDVIVLVAFAFSLTFLAAFVWERRRQRRTTRPHAGSNSTGLPSDQV